MDSSGATGPALARLSTKDVQSLLGPDPLFSQGRHVGDVADPDVASLQAARFHGLPIVFLGLHEHADTTGAGSRALPSTEFSAKHDAEGVVANIHGTPYFSVDVSDAREDELQSVLKNSEAGMSGAKLEFLDGRAAMGSFTQFDSAVFSEARSLIDWTARNKVSVLVVSISLLLIELYMIMTSTVLVAVHLSTPCGQVGNMLAPLFCRGLLPR